jgi:hypothetical protein
MSFESRALRLERAHGRVGADDMVVAVAADFLHGGEPTFARVFDRRGSLLLGLQRLRDESWRAFEARARVEAGKVAGACSLLIGGLPDGGGDVGGDSGEGNVSPLPTDDLPRGAITLPEVALHCSQIEALELVRQHRRVALVAGRRWGKSTILITLAVDAALSGRRVGMFAPTRTLMSPLLMEIARGLVDQDQVILATTSCSLAMIDAPEVDMAAIGQPDLAEHGIDRSAGYRPQSAHDEGYLTDTFPSAIAPTLIDYAGAIVEASTPNGVEPTNHFWQCAHLAELGFVVHHAPTSANPHLPAEEIRALRATMRPEIASQELDALFVSLEGMSIFPLASLLENGEPVPDDGPIDTIGVAIDSAAGEGGFEHDGTAAIVYGMRQPRVAPGGFEGGQVVILDWDIRSLALGAAGAWLRHVNDLYRHWIQRARPRMGLDGIWIEKPAMGLRLLELAGEQRIAAQEINTEWVEWGKDGRALAVEPHVTAGRVRFARSAYDKRMEYKGAVYNHALAQITGFRAFDKKASKRADDLADAFMYAVLRCLGDGRARRWDKIKRAS